MNCKRFCSLLVSLLLLAALSACAPAGAGSAASAIPPSDSGEIYLYGEQHGVQKILNREFELWQEHYNTRGMRHLFVELPYYTGEFLNRWMQDDDDAILDAVYDDWDGTDAHTPDVKAFYQKIKRECPETVFHGTDVGHQRQATGKRFLQNLEEAGQRDSEQYRLTEEAIRQGETYYGKDDNVYRENTMTENFIREFDRLDGESVMGIYGGAHTGIDAMEYTTGSVPCMANQLASRYGATLYSEDLSWLAKDIDPLKVETVTLAGKAYQASYFGEEDMTGLLKGVRSRAFWRLESAYEDFKAQPKTGDVLPYDNFPMLVEAGQVFIIDYTKTDGSVTRQYYRSDGHEWEGRLSTEEFSVN
ncbi:hypothetical protein [Oscillibacter sp.]|uniref:hypothetical protein n=1 Tax=Oscillibacter sp. TaxID=1945593 RepID=UPI00289C943D|nr:hypothetical protein [Oscillibacter sp.]